MSVSNFRLSASASEGMLQIPKAMDRILKPRFVILRLGYNQLFLLDYLFIAEFRKF